MSDSTTSGPPLGRRLLNPVLTTLLFTFIRITVEGKEHFPPQGPFLVIFNHTHWLDPAVIANQCPRYVVPMAKAETRDYPFLGYLLRGYHMIFVQRGTADLSSLRTARRVLEAGRGLMIAPEGTRSPDGTLQRGRPGMVYLARGLKTAIVPVGVTGPTDFDFTDSLKRLYRTPIHMRIGPAFRLRKIETKARGELQQKLTDAAMQRVARLLPPELRGYYTKEDPKLEEWLEPL